MLSLSEDIHRDCLSVISTFFYDKDMISSINVDSIILEDELKENIEPKHLKRLKSILEYCNQYKYTDISSGKDVGIKKSSAQITHYYNSENLLGKQVIGVCNFPKKNIAGVVSEVLILGAIEKDGKVVLVHPSQKTDNGLEIA